MPDYQMKPSEALLNGPAIGAIEVTPSDTEDLAITSRGLYVGTAGDIKMTMRDGSVVTRVDVQPGMYPWQITRIWATGTTAADIIADY